MAIPFISAIKSAYILTGGSYVMQFQKAVRPLRGEISVPGDKSISHRAVMFGAISEGTTEVTNFLQGADCLSTISCFRSMGIEIENTPERILIHGKGLHGLSAPSAVLDCGNSGTTTRLISGILAGQNFSSTLTGDASIQKRPMGRIINPLTQMGASIRSIPENGCAPLAINGHPLHAISYLSPVASAQVKSCVLLAGLYADGKTSVTEPALSRNHTELMLKFFGADVASEGLTASVLPNPDLHGNLVRVPGDISSAAYFIAAALIVPGSEVLLKNVGINPTRDGMLRVCRAMGADITLLNEQNSGGEPVADLLVRYTPSLSGTVIEGELIPTLIDEIPIIAVLAATANGTTVIRNAEELKVKESNRLDIMVNELTAMGVSLEGTDDGMIIEAENRSTAPKSTAASTTALRCRLQSLRLPQRHRRKSCAPAVWISRIRHSTRIWHGCRHKKRLNKKWIVKIISSQSIFLLLPCSSGRSNRFSLPYPRFDSKPRIIPDPFFRHCASLLCQNDHCRTTEGKIAFLFAALYTSRRSGIFIDNLSDHHRADLHLQQCAEICGLQQRVGSRIFFIDRAKIIRRRIDRVEHTLNPPFRRTDAVIHKEIPVIIVHGKPKQK